MHARCARKLTIQRSWRLTCHHTVRRSRPVLSTEIACIKELVMDGKNVKLDDLAIFSAGLRTLPANSPEEFTASANIDSVRLRARSTGVFRSSVLTREAKTKQFSQYMVGEGSEVEMP